MSRLPLELCLLVIDSIGLGRADAGAWDYGHTGCCMDTLKACSLVCMAWYHHTVPYLWSSITLDIQPTDPQTVSDGDACLVVRREWLESPKNWQEATLPLANVLAIFQSNRRLMSSVCHFNLGLSSTVHKRELATTPELVEFCKALPPLPRFSWRVDDLEDDTIFTPSYDVADDDEHVLGQIVTPFCHSPALTTFTFTGETFPFDILKAMPNLKDLSFIDVWRCITPYSLANKPYLFQPLPFICKPYIFA